MRSTTESAPVMGRGSIRRPWRNRRACAMIAPVSRGVPGPLARAPNAPRTASPGSLRDLAGNVNDLAALKRLSSSSMERRSSAKRAVLPAPVEPGFQPVDTDPTEWPPIRPNGRGIPIALRTGIGHASARSLPRVGRLPQPKRPKPPSPTSPLREPSGSRGPASQHRSSTSG